PTIPGLQLVQVSAQRGTDSEDVGIVADGGGGYVTIQVSGYNGAFSPSPYTLRVEEQGPLTAPACPARTWPHLADAVRGTLAPGVPAGANVAFLVDRWRLTATYGATDAGNVLTALNALAGRSDLGVNGVVVPVDGYASVWSAQQAWDADPCSTAAANATAQAIAAAAQGLRASAPGLKYVVIVGGDDQIPFFRVPDTTLVANEQSYAAALGSNEYGAALSTQNILSDDPYGTLDPVPLGGRPLYVPELAVGRLVETAQQIRQQLLGFTAGAAPGVLDRSTAFVSGYDFMSDGSQRIADNLTAGGVAVSTLISDTYDKGGLLNGIFPPGGSPADIVVPNGHYDHFRAQPAAGGELLTTADVGPLPGRVVFTMGCHAGLAVSDVILGNTGAQTDWAQSLTAGGATFAANSGYGLGESTSVSYSEELTADFAAHLDGTGTIGDALVQAKRDYYLARGAFSSYDEKALNELVFYGLPFWSLGARRVPLAATTTHAAAASPTTSATPPAASPIVL
ncbi:MAG TPA: C25 family cysteine peptidase, partial [Gaiellaceae bacterium]